MPESLIKPNWELPKNVGAVFTTRLGGISPEPWDSLNLGINTSDLFTNLKANRSLLAEAMPAGIEVQWLRQMHGTDAYSTSAIEPDSPAADICYTRTPGIACAVLTADCLPILISNSAGTEVAAVHAGWRGLAAGVLNHTIDLFDSDTSDLQVWIGPGISQKAFEVGEDVRQAMLESGRLEQNSQKLFFSIHPSKSHKYYLDLVGVARHNLRELGVDKISGGEFCTYSDARRFFSYRRDGETGRMASLIWISP